ncbi:MAG: glycosyltransferase [Candidatus Brocadia sp.]|nr:glycosyltransferase [Candidatus Brocadia sp.]
MDNALIVFLKYPNPGQVKTRLATDIGEERACFIYQSLAEQIVRHIFPVKPRTYEVGIFFTPADKEDEIKAWLNPLLSAIPGADVQFISQEGNELGDRISHAFKKTLQSYSHGKEDKMSSSRKAIIIGTDCPEIDAELIENAFEVLKEKDVVIGPCKDGGYYLIGMSRHMPDLFTGIDWSTNRVFAQTIEKIQKKNLSCGILKTLADIDRFEDLCGRKDSPLW